MMSDFDRAFWDVPTALAWIGGDVDDAIDVLIRAAEAGRVEVTAMPDTGGARTALRPVDWCDLDIVNADGEWLIVGPGWVPRARPNPRDEDVIREDLNVFAGGVTWIDADYDAAVAGMAYKQARFVASELLEMFPRNRMVSDPSTEGTQVRKSKRGARAKADWPDLQKQFNKRVKLIGFPGESNEFDWQRPGDVTDWLVELIEADGIDCSRKTVEGYTRRFMAAAKLDEANSNPIQSNPSRQNR
jgi:hypothetical protein